MFNPLFFTFKVMHNNGKEEVTLAGKVAMQRALEYYIDESCKNPTDVPLATMKKMLPFFWTLTKPETTSVSWVT